MAGRHTCNVSCAHSGKETLRAPGKKTLIGRKEVSGEGRGKLLRKLRRFEYICLIKKKSLKSAEELVDGEDDYL